jgi:hypothetical protein
MVVMGDWLYRLNETDRGMDVDFARQYIESLDVLAGGIHDSKYNLER